MNKQPLPLQQNNKNDVPLDSLPKKTLCDIIASNMLQIAQLTTENNALQTRNAELENDKQIYYTIIEENKKLIKEHEMSIEKLLNENILLNDKISSLEIQNIKLTTELNDLKKNHNDLSNKFINMENKKVFDNFVVAIQDLNSLDELEKKVNIVTKKELVKLKNKRISNCHYLDHRDDEDVKNDKRTILEYEINNMPSDIKKLFDMKYPNLLGEITKYIIIKKTSPTIDFAQEMKEWFYE
ncbi:hypothetical protein BMW23_1062 [Bodo saltans virus]|uniref:Uncharacterized protein n=1 Tax=Bodo saltans virus TaxID=2024608 RepID=A0A2H4UW52_9VIRU|nr:hypothetical protein QJ851_gp1043 [Bodo saltans virus]ATZ81106.1 hypothetical protein BMW23_1062 [Bodo saltans virus]